MIMNMDKGNCVYYATICSNLRSRLDEFSGDRFKNFILKAYSDSIWKTFRNKRKFRLQTFFCNALEAVLRIAFVGFVCYGYSKYLCNILDSFEITIAQGVSILGVVCVFGVLYRILLLSIRYFDPRETWVRHSVNLNRMTVEIIQYLDMAGEYDLLGSIDAYKLFRRNSLKILSDNMNTFQNNMKHNNKRRDGLGEMFEKMKRS